MIDTTEVREQASSRRFTHRLVFLEEPSVVQWLEARATADGCSVATVVRGAIRFLRSAYDKQDG